MFGFEAAFWAVAMMGLMWWQANMGIWIRPYILAVFSTLRDSARVRKSPTLILEKSGLSAINNNSIQEF